MRSGLLLGSNQRIDSGLPLRSCALCYPGIDPGVDQRMIPCDHSYRRVDPGCDHGSDRRERPTLELTKDLILEGTVDKTKKTSHLRSLHRDFGIDYSSVHRIIRFTPGG